MRAKKRKLAQFETDQSREDQGLITVRSRGGVSLVKTDRITE